MTRPRRLPPENSLDTVFAQCEAKLKAYTDALYRGDVQTMKEIEYHTSGITYGDVIDSTKKTASRETLQRPA